MASKNYEEELAAEADHYLKMLEGYSRNESPSLNGPVNVDLERSFGSCLALCDIGIRCASLSKDSKARLEAIRQRAYRAHPNFTLWSTPFLKSGNNNGLVNANGFL